jgi:hypothetical protein
MATQKQYNYYQILCNQLGQEHDENFQNLPSDVASKEINELNTILNNKKSKEDTCYWY